MSSPNDTGVVVAFRGSAPPAAPAPHHHESAALAAAASQLEALAAPLPYASPWRARLLRDAATYRSATQIVAIRERH